MSYEPCDDCGANALIVYDDGRGNRLCAECYHAYQEATIESDHRLMELMDKTADLIH